MDKEEKEKPVQEKEEKSIFGAQNDETKIILDLNADIKKETNTTLDKVTQTISKLHTSAINIKNTIGLLENSIEASDTISTPNFIKRLKNMGTQHQKFLEELVLFNNNQELAPDTINTVQEEIEQNTELMKQIEALLDIAQDSLINPEKYKKDVKNLLETYTIKRNQKEDKSSEEKQAPKEENKQENKPKEILKPIHTQTNEPITVNIDSISEKRDKESELDIEITEPVKGNVSMNTSLFINKKATQNENIEKDKIQETVKQHQFGLPISSNTLHQKPIPEKKEIKPQEEETEEIDVYDFMMNKKGSNAKKLVEFHIEDIEKD